APCAWPASRSGAADSASSTRTRATAARTSTASTAASSTGPIRLPEPSRRAISGTERESFLPGVLGRQEPRTRCRRRVTAPGAGPADDTMDPLIRRGNYDSGQDYVLEYGELRFTFNERDFSERVEQSAHRLGFVAGRLDPSEL